jgi:ABC-type multidrug transport system ATPase subunit
VSGFAIPGETLFIMGSSGAGKTTLLNSLCDRVKKVSPNKFNGKVLINDSSELDSDNFGKYGAYVMQDDILFETFKCAEAL